MDGEREGGQRGRGGKGKGGGRVKRQEEEGNYIMVEWRRKTEERQTTLIHQNNVAVHF